MTSPARQSNAVVSRVSGPIVTATGMFGAQMYEVVEVGEAGWSARSCDCRATGRPSRSTKTRRMLKPGAPVKRTGAPLSLQLGPGLIGNIYDGIQRSLPGMHELSGAWIVRGEKVPPLDSEKRWTFEPTAEVGQAVTGGQILGEVPETAADQASHHGPAGRLGHAAFAGRSRASTPSATRSPWSRRPPGREN